MKPRRPFPPTDPWQRLLAARRLSFEESPDAAAPPEFAARVIARWRRVTRTSFAAASGDALWETMGLRAALAAGALACAVLLLNLSTLHDVGPNLDADALDPASLLLGPSL